MGLETIKMRCTRPDRASVSLQGQMYAVDAHGFIDVLPIHADAARSQDFVAPHEYDEVVAARRAQQSLLDKYQKSKFDDTGSPQDATTSAMMSLLAQQGDTIAKLQAQLAALTAPAAPKAPTK